MKRETSHLGTTHAGRQRHLSRLSVLRRHKETQEDHQQSNVHAICTQTIPRAALCEDVSTLILLCNAHAPADLTTSRADSFNHSFAALASDADRVAQLLAQDVGARGVEFLVRDKLPGFRKMIYRGEDDVQRERHQEDVEVPGVIDVEEAEAAVNYFLRGRQFGVILVEALNGL